MVVSRFIICTLTQAASICSQSKRERSILSVVVYREGRGQPMECRRTYHLQVRPAVIKMSIRQVTDSCVEKTFDAARFRSPALYCPVIQHTTVFLKAVAAPMIIHYHSG